MRIPKRLVPLVEEGLIDEVIRPLMSGKEAAVWLVESRGEVVCAKVYKEASKRSFKHRSSYTEGRKVRNSRRARAMAKRTKYGRQQEEEAWQTVEVDMLYKLAAADVAVPEPYVFTDGVLLMELLMDPEGRPAPRLFDVRLSGDDARDAHEWLMRQCVRMLCAGVVHGDLSEYNVLWTWRGPVIIDLPQAVDATGNRNARDIFTRDVRGLTAYLARFAPELARTQYDQEIWRLYERGKLHPEVPLTGRFKQRRRGRVDGSRLAKEVVEIQRDEARYRRSRQD